MKQHPVNESEELQRRIRFLQRSIVQLVSQPQLQRRRLYQNLYANLHAARQQLRELTEQNSLGPRAVA
jgi:hypothetical protein